MSLPFFYYRGLKWFRADKHDEAEQQVYRRFEGRKLVLSRREW